MVNGEYDEYINMQNELMAIKIILEPCLSVSDDLKQCSCPIGKIITQESVKYAINAYLSKKKPLPVRIFKEEYSAMIMMVLQNQRELL